MQIDVHTLPPTQNKTGPHSPSQQSSEALLLCSSPFVLVLIFLPLGTCQTFTHLAHIRALSGILYPARLENRPEAVREQEIGDASVISSRAARPPASYHVYNHGRNYLPVVEGAVSRDHLEVQKSYRNRTRLMSCSHLYTQHGE